MTLVIEGNIKIERDFVKYYLYIFYVSTLFENDCQQSWNYSRLKMSLMLPNIILPSVAKGIISEIKISVYRFFLKSFS